MLHCVVLGELTLLFHVLTLLVQHILHSLVCFGYILPLLVSPCVRLNRPLIELLLPLKFRLLSLFFVPLGLLVPVLLVDGLERLQLHLLFLLLNAEFFYLLVEFVSLLDGFLHLALKTNINLILLIVNLDLLSHTRPQKLECLLCLVRDVGTECLGGQTSILDQFDFMVLVFVKRLLC